jgi:hypothetical protein
MQSSSVARHASKLESTCAIRAGDDRGLFRLGGGLHARSRRRGTVWHADRAGHSQQHFAGLSDSRCGLLGELDGASQVAKVALPIVANAVAPGIGGALASRAVSLLGEEEWESELVHELGGLHEGHPESILHELGESHETALHEGHPEAVLHELGESHETGLHEGHPESVLHELGAGHEAALHEAHLEGILHEGHLEHSQEMLAELMAEMAAGAHVAGEAEAMVGAATVVTLSAADRVALRRLIPHLTRGAAVLTRLLRRRRITRPAVRTVPTIVRQTARALRRRAASGAPVTRRVAGQIMGTVARKVIGNPRLCAHAIAKNVKSSMCSKRGIRPVAG